MTPNLIGSTFLLAETAIANTNDANNNNSNKSAAMVDERVPSQGNPIPNSTSNSKGTEEGKSQKPYQMEIVWFNVLLFVVLHSTALYGLYLIFAENAYLDYVWSYFVTFLGGLGITAGVHRLWSHRAYKARVPLRIFLMLCQSLAFQNSIHEWTRDHRVHHKFTDTDADPHNSKRGFFFAHMGWLMCKKHPDVKSKGKIIDMSDLEADPVVMFQKKFYFVIMPICCFVLPALFPYYVLGSSWQVCFFVSCMLRYTISLHGTWLVNSAAHFYGMKPYDKNISPVNTKLVSLVTFGEGWHNYHHVFPWDYKAAELGSYETNWSTGFIDLMAKIGQAYDLKSVSEEMVVRRVRRTGDGTHAAVIDVNNNSSGAITNEMVMQLDHEKEPTMVWGWDDKDICEDDRRAANIIEKKND